MKKLLATVLMAVTATVWAWQPKDKTINVQIPFTPGSGNEMSFRAVAAIVEQQHKINFLIHNTPGADGNLGMNAFSSMPKNGTWIAVPSCQSTFVAAEIHWHDVIKYQPMDLTFVTNIAKSPLAFIANTNSVINTPRDLVKQVKDNQRNITFAVGSSAHKLAYEYFIDNMKSKTDKTNYVNYKGPLPAAQDVAGGHAELGIVPIAVAQTLLSTGKIKIIGLASEQKLSALPNVPLMQDYVPGLNVYACWNIVLPEGTDIAIQQWFAKVFTQAIRSPNARKFFDNNLMFVDERALGPEGVKKDMLALRQQWSDYVRRMPSPK